MSILNQIRHAIYGMYLTNSYGLRLKKVKSNDEKKALRVAYAHAQLDALSVKVKVENPDNIPKKGTFLLVSNHRSVIDPLIVEIALESSGIFGLWISKKELYNSPFFGLFVRNAGAILIDREQSQMSGFFAEVKKGVEQGCSIFIFPEGTRNKSDKPLGKFKEGSRIIALKNRLPILPVYIKENADEILHNAMKKGAKQQEVTIVIGEEISYKEKRDLEEVYKERFGI